MIRFLWIPVLGTIAAIIAVALSHGERDDFTYSSPNPRTTRDDVRPPPEVDDPMPDPEPDDGEGEEPEDELPPPPGKSSYVLRLRPNGSLLDDEDGTEYEDIDKLLERLKGGPRATVTVMNDSGEVAEAALDALGAKLQPHADFRKDYRAPEKKSEDDKK